MKDDWLQEEEPLAFNEIEPFIPPTAPRQSAAPQSNKLPPRGERPPSPQLEKEVVDYPLRSLSGQYALPPYWSRRATGHERHSARSREADTMPCCTGAMRASLHQHGRRVLCLSCKTIYRFGRPIGHAPAVNVGHRYRR